MSRILYLLFGAAIAYVGSGYLEGLLTQGNREEAKFDVNLANS